MTDHADLSRRLALAIGWPEKIVFMVAQVTYVIVGMGDPWRRFDYRDPLVIWPIAERYRCFPRNWRDGMWVSHTTVASTPAEAVARAVIGGNKG